MSPDPRLHPDFAGVTVEPGAAHVRSRPELFDIVNLLAFGGAADRPTHVPTELGGVGPVVLWESTGAADALPFWNTNFRTDVYLYLVHGGVRVVLKEVEGSEVYGEYVARTGDLFRLPKDIAHRTYSLDGRRRVSLEFLERDPGWATLGSLADVSPAAEPRLGGFAFAEAGDTVTITAGDTVAASPAGFFRRGLRALVAWELHLGHNEFEGGFVVHDEGDAVTFKLAGHTETFAPADVLALFKHLLGSSAGGRRR